MSFHARQTSVAIETSAVAALSVPPVRIVLVDWHPTSKHIVASVNRRIHTFAMKVLQLSEHGRFDVLPLRSLGKI